MTIFAVQVFRVEDGYVAVCECGHRSEVRISKAILRMHVAQTWGEHIRERHLSREDEESDA